MQRVALIVGVSGQDGAFLAEHLLSKNYKIVGTSRDVANRSFSNLKRLGIFERVELLSATATDFRSISTVIHAVAPDEIYNLSGQSTSSDSYEQPFETFDSIAVATLNLLEAVRTSRRNMRFYSSCSSECFGTLPPGVAANEMTPFRPLNPYGIARAAAFWSVANYRARYGLYACSAILFNHESYLRPTRFVTQKVIAAAVRIAEGSQERLQLGDLSVERDWGWAPDYVRAMSAMLQLPEPTDLVIATGRSHTLQDFVSASFDAVGLDWRKHVDLSPGLLRPQELRRSCGDPARAAEILGWRPVAMLDDIVREMVAANRTLLLPKSHQENIGT